MNGNDEDEFGRSVTEQVTGQGWAGQPITWRTQPGATPSPRNSGSSLTPQNQWARMFASTPGSTYVSGFAKSQNTASSQVMNVLDDVLRNTPFNFGSLTSPKQPFSTVPTNQVPNLISAQPSTLTGMLGATHAQAWMNPSDQFKAGMKSVAPYADMNAPWKTTYGQPEKDKFAWGSGFR